MLVLTRKPGQSIMIGEDITVRVIEVQGDLVKIGIDAPREVSVHRREVYEQIIEENIQAVKLDEKSVEELKKLFPPAKVSCRRDEKISD